MKDLWRIGRAFCIAAWGHRKQRDKAGKRYIWHLVRVAWIAYGLQPSVNVVLVGLLHDYLEDVDRHAKPKLVRVFGWPAAMAVECLTRKEGVAYTEYSRILLLCAPYLSQVVKLADLLDNTQPGRMPQEQRDSERGMQYLDALEALTRQRVLRSWGGEW
jgi:(p)ppGpp synthase/HD superfamily hydrolase